ncbi:MAG TPA: TadE/TadG family type IV pilus assembly protein [Acidimicrobiales bacterium]|nr:TadE/TadG family type IV pilus assembly protein [Acidimicrobiales bacterium]
MAIEAVIVVPMAMVMVLLAVQACLWAHAAAIVQGAAAQGDQAACDLGGSIPGGIDQARQFMAGSESSLVANPVVTSSVPVAGEVEIDVRGTAESILPWLHLTVSARRRGVVQEFRSQE